MDSTASLVAVVDDDPSILKGLSSLLRAVGYDVETYDDATSFLASSAASRASCMVTDIQMPEMDGFALQDAIRQEWPGLPIIFMTAIGDPATRKKAIDGGARHVLIKPFSTDRLLAEIGLAVGREEA